VTERRSASDKQAKATKQTRSPSKKPFREVSDARTMRAVAHPLRIALLEALGREGSLTATQAAELLGDSPGNMSWHLQTLAKYGFVEEAGGGRGRSRPWRAVSAVHRFDTASDDADVSTASDALEATIQEGVYQRQREWWSQRRSYPVAWRKAAFADVAMTYLTAEEMQRLGDDIMALLEPYRGRTGENAKRPADALPVHLVAFGHPVTASPSGK
jgi:DNA-binding transcriptional ArsR family regulator